MTELSQTILRGTDQVSEGYQALARARAEHARVKRADLEGITEAFQDAAKSYKTAVDWKDAKDQEDDERDLDNAYTLGITTKGAEGGLAALEAQPTRTAGGARRKVDLVFKTKGLLSEQNQTLLQQAQAEVARRNAERLDKDNEKYDLEVKSRGEAAQWWKKQYAGTSYRRLAEFYAGKGYEVPKDVQSLAELEAKDDKVVTEAGTRTNIQEMKDKQRELDRKQREADRTQELNIKNADRAEKARQFNVSDTQKTRQLNLVEADNKAEAAAQLLKIDVSGYRAQLDRWEADHDARYDSKSKEWSTVEAEWMKLEDQVNDLVLANEEGHAASVRKTANILRSNADTLRKQLDKLSQEVPPQLPAKILKQLEGLDTQDTPAQKPVTPGMSWQDYTE